VRVLLGAGADPSWIGLNNEDLITLARDRGHEAVALLLESARTDRGRSTAADAPADQPIHEAAAAGDTARVSLLLDDDPRFVCRVDRAGGTPGLRIPVRPTRAAAGC
jgi:hypothetical protein